MLRLDFHQSSWSFTNSCTVLVVNAQFKVKPSPCTSALWRAFLTWQELFSWQNYLELIPTQVVESYQNPTWYVRNPSTEFNPQNKLLSFLPWTKSSSMWSYPSSIHSLLVNGMSFAKPKCSREKQISGKWICLGRLRARGQDGINRLRNLGILLAGDRGAANRAT